MKERKVHRCECPKCQASADHAEAEIHRQMNLLLSRLDEDQRRWYVALEAKKRGRGGIKELCEITGMHSDTIRRGWRELDNELKGQPTDRIRQPGGGRLRTEKNASGPR